MITEPFDRDVLAMTWHLLYRWSESLLVYLPTPVWNVGTASVLDSFDLAQEIRAAAGKCAASTEAAIAVGLSNGQAASLDRETHYWLWRRCYCARNFLSAFLDSSGVGFPFLQPAEGTDAKTFALHLLTDWWDAHGPRLLAEELTSIQHDHDVGSPRVID